MLNTLETRFCANPRCKKPLSLNQHKDGLETPAKFAARKYCDHQCSATGASIAAAKKACRPAFHERQAAINEMLMEWR